MSLFTRTRSVCMLCNPLTFSTDVPVMSNVCTLCNLDMCFTLVSDMFNV